MTSTPEPEEVLFSTPVRLVSPITPQNNTTLDEEGLRFVKVVSVSPILKFKAVKRKKKINVYDLCQRCGLLMISCMCTHKKINYDKCD